MTWDGVERRKMNVSIPHRRKMQDWLSPAMRYTIVLLLGIAGTLERDNARLRELATKDAITRQETYQAIDEKLSPVYSKLTIIDSGVSQVLTRFDDLQNWVRENSRRPDVVWKHYGKGN